jgi:acyl carrier protein
MSAGPTEATVLSLLESHVRTDIRPTPETDILADTGLDSMGVMDFVLDLEEAFDITIPLDRLNDVRTVSDVVAAVERIANETPQPDAPSEDVGGKA